VIHRRLQGRTSLTQLLPEPSRKHLLQRFAQAESFVLSQLLDAPLASRQALEEPVLQVAIHIVERRLTAHEDQRIRKSSRQNSAKLLVQRQIKGWMELSRFTLGAELGRAPSPNRLDLLAR
jgi:hypothetical protein